MTSTSKPPLPLRIQPEPDESMASWLRRYSNALHCSDRQLLDLLGIPTTSIGRIRWFGAAISNELANHVAQRTGLPVANIDNTTLAGRYNHLPGMDLAKERHNKPDQQIRSHLAWGRLAGTTICPCCVTETGRHKLWWKLHLAAACPKHKTLLVERCPACETRWGADAYGNARTFPQRPNPPINICGRRSRNQSCVQPIYAIQPIPAEPETVAAQAWILDKLDDRHPTLFGNTRTPAQYVHAVQCLWTIAVNLGPLEQASETARQGWESIDKPGHTINGAPQGIQQAALAIETAHTVLTQPTINNAAKLTEPRWGQQQNTRRFKRAQQNRIKPHPDLTAIHKQTEDPQRGVASIGHDSHARPDLDPEHIPQLLPLDLAQPLLQIAHPARELRIRMAATLIICRTATGEPWATCAQRLGYNGRVNSIQRFAKTVLKHSDHPDLWPALDQAANRFANQQINYNQRRTELAGLTHIEDNDWATITNSTEITNPYTQQWAPIWLWEHHTHSPWTWAPGWPNVEWRRRPGQDYLTIRPKLTDTIGPDLQNWAQKTAPV